MDRTNSYGLITMAKNSKLQLMISYPTNQCIGKIISLTSPIRRANTFGLTDVNSLLYAFPQSSARGVRFPQQAINKMDKMK